MMIETFSSSPPPPTTTTTGGGGDYADELTGYFHQLLLDGSTSDVLLEVMDSSMEISLGTFDTHALILGRCRMLRSQLLNHHTRQMCGEQQQKRSMASRHRQYLRIGSPFTDEGEDTRKTISTLIHLLYIPFLSPAISTDKEVCKEVDYHCLSLYELASSWGYNELLPHLEMRMVQLVDNRTLSEFMQISLIYTDMNVLRKVCTQALKGYGFMMELPFVQRLCESRALDGRTCRHLLRTLLEELIVSPDFYCYHSMRQRMMELLEERFVNVSVLDDAKSLQISRDTLTHYGHISTERDHCSLVRFEPILLESLDQIHGPGTLDALLSTSPVTFKCIRVLVHSFKMPRILGDVTAHVWLTRDRASQSGVTLSLIFEYVSTTTQQQQPASKRSFHVSSCVIGMYRSSLNEEQHPGVPVGGRLDTKHDVIAEMREPLRWYNEETGNLERILPIIIYIYVK